MKRMTAVKSRGMTLIEILVVLVLIGIVMGIVGGNFIGRGEKAKGDAARIEIGQIGQTLDLFKLEIGRYPTTQEGLAGAGRGAPRRHQLERSVLEEGHDAEGSLGQRLHLHRAGTARRVRHRVVRGRRQGRRRWPEQGHRQLAVTTLRGAAGVTLLELLIVLMLMALVAGFVLPTFGGGITPGMLKGAARELAAGLKLARSEAISRRAETTLDLDILSHTFRVPPDERDGATARQDRSQALHRAEGPGERPGRLDPILSRRRLQRRPHFRAGRQRDEI